LPFIVRQARTGIASQIDVGILNFEFFDLNFEWEQYVYQFTEADRVWNRACGQGDCDNPGVGDSALAALLAFHGVAMNGGVLHALEACSGVDIGAATAGYRFFGLAEVANVIEAALAELQEIQARGDDPEEIDRLEPALEDRYATHVPADQTLVDAFERVFERRRDDFQPI